MYQVHTALSQLTANNIKELDATERHGLFLRRAAAELAYQAWLAASDERRTMARPFTDENLSAATRVLVAADAAISGDYVHPADRNENAEAHAVRNVRVGIALGWRLAALEHSGKDITPR